MYYLYFVAKNHNYQHALNLLVLVVYDELLYFQTQMINNRCVMIDVLMMKNFTLPIYIAGGVDSRGVQFWFIAVRTMIAVILPLILCLLAQRYIVRGLTLGAVKG